MIDDVPYITIPELRSKFAPLSLEDLVTLVQGSEHDRDSAATLGQILESQVIQSFLSDRDNWRTFTAPETGIITLGDYNRNVIIVPSAKDQDIRLDHFPTNGLIIYAPDWDAESESTAVTIVGKVLNSYKTLPVIKGGVGIFLCSGQLVISSSLISNSAHSLAILKELIVDDLIVKSDLTLPASSILSTHIANKAITSDKLADQLSFVKTPKYPKKVYKTIVVTEGVVYYAEPNYDGVRFSTQGTHTIIVRMNFSDADNESQIRDTYRILNETPNAITVKDRTTEDVFTKVPAWSFKDFYYDEAPGWNLP